MVDNEIAFYNMRCQKRLHNLTPNELPLPTVAGIWFLPFLSLLRFFFFFSYFPLLRSSRFPVSTCFHCQWLFPAFRLFSSSFFLLVSPHSSGIVFICLHFVLLRFEFRRWASRPNGRASIRWFALTACRTPRRSQKPSIGRNDRILLMALDG